jgi:hypothetical protein
MFVCAIFLILINSAAARNMRGTAVQKARLLKSINETIDTPPTEAPEPSFDSNPLLDDDTVFEIDGHMLRSLRKLRAKFDPHHTHEHEHIKPRSLQLLEEGIKEDKNSSEDDSSVLRWLTSLLPASEEISGTGEEITVDTESRNLHHAPEEVIYEADYSTSQTHDEARHLEQDDENAKEHGDDEIIEEHAEEHIDDVKEHADDVEKIAPTGEAQLKGEKRKLKNDERKLKAKKKAQTAASAPEEVSPEMLESMRGLQTKEKAEAAKPLGA